MPIKMRESSNEDEPAGSPAGDNVTPEGKVAKTLRNEDGLDQGDTEEAGDDVTEEVARGQVVTTNGNHEKSDSKVIQYL